MKRSICALMTAATLAGCQSPTGRLQTYGHTSAGSAKQVAATSSKPTEKVDPEIVQAGYNMGHGAMQNNQFSHQRVARALPSHGGALPGGMPGGLPGAPMPGGPGCALGPGGPGMGPVAGMGPGLAPRFTTGRTQVRFTAPIGMNIAWQSSEAIGEFTAPQLEVPARYNFVQGRIYRLKVSGITNVEGLAGQDLYPTLEVYPGNAKVNAYLAHNTVPIEFTAEDFQQVVTGNYVTKVIYLPDPEFQDLAIAGVDVLVSTRLDPCQDPIEEAHRRGAILAVVRLGSVDLEMPHSPGLFPGAP